MKSLEVLDELTPWASWSDELIMEWAKNMRLDRYPRAYVELATASLTSPNIAEIDWQAGTVARFRDTDYDRLEAIYGNR